MDYNEDEEEIPDLAGILGKICGPGALMRRKLEASRECQESRSKLDEATEGVLYDMHQALVTDPNITFKAMACVMRSFSELEQEMEETCRPLGHNLIRILMEAMIRRCEGQRDHSVRCDRIIREHVPELNGDEIPATGEGAP